MKTNINIQEVIKIAKDAGKAILEIYNSGEFNVEIKKDNSPLTKADKAAHNIIAKGLKLLYPDIPLLSEEGKEIEYTERLKWNTFWLVDPLDGTKEFIKKNGEFTVNIALIENNLPVLGVIFVPVTKELYYGDLKNGSYKIDSEGKRTKLMVSNKSSKDFLTVVQSRSHSGEEEEKFYSQYNVQNKISKGSSLKICLVAEGNADLYFRGGPTWEWDTAAGHAIALGAGGVFVNKDFSNLTYNKEIIKNFGFIVSAPNLI